MAVISLNNPSRSAGAFSLLETDVYRMKIVRANIETDQFAEARKDGTQPEKLVLCWEVSEAGPDQDEGVVGLSVWQRMNPYYGSIREGGVSKFKAFLDSLAEQGLIELNLAVGFDTETLIGIEQRVSVEKYTKTMGTNAGQPGNRVATILPLRRKAAAKAAPAPKRNIPVAVDDTDGEERGARVMRQQAKWAAARRLPENTVEAEYVVSTTPQIAAPRNVPVVMGDTDEL